MDNFTISDGYFNISTNNYKFKCRVPLKSPTGLELPFSEAKSHRFILKNKKGFPFLFCILKHQNKFFKDPVNTRDYETNVKYLKFKTNFNANDIIPSDTKLIPVITIHEEDTEFKEDSKVFKALKAYVLNFDTPVEGNIGYKDEELRRHLNTITKTTTVPKGIDIDVDFILPLTTTNGGVLRPGRV